jgi:hypothetical protein
VVETQEVAAQCSFPILADQRDLALLITDLIMWNDGTDLITWGGTQLCSW